MSRYGNVNSATIAIAEAWRFNEIPDEDIFKIDNQTLMKNVGKGTNNSSSLFYRQNVSRGACYKRMTRSGQLTGVSKTKCCFKSI